MQDKFPNDSLENAKNEIFENALEAIHLTEVKEFKNFTLGLNYDDEVCQDLILRLRENDSEERVSILFEESPPIIKRFLTYQKQKELLLILEDVSRRYKTKDKRIFDLAFATMLLLEDRVFEIEKIPLLFACFNLDLKDMEDELFIDPHYFSCRAEENLKKNNLAEAERFSLLECSVTPEHWDPYARLTQIYDLQKNHNGAIINIKKALDLIYKYWQKNHEYLDFEVVEAVEQIADRVLKRASSEYLKRLNQYAYGLLYFLGTAPINTVVQEIKALVPTESTFGINEFLNIVKNEGKIKIHSDLLYHPDVDDPQALYDEVLRRKIVQASPFSLSALKLAQEGRLHEFFFTIEPSMEDLDDDLLDKTEGKFGLIEIYEELRKDVENRKHHDLLINRFIQERNPHINELLEEFTFIWNHFPRWELSGRSPRQMAEDRANEGQPSEWHKSITTFKRPQVNQTSTHPKVGRNDSCVCGSGIKYKKCCGK